MKSFLLEDGAESLNLNRLFDPFGEELGDDKEDDL
jgi:hypothetical protein